MMLLSVTTIFKMNTQTCLEQFTSKFYTNEHLKKLYKQFIKKNLMLVVEGHPSRQLLLTSYRSEFQTEI